MFRAVVVVFEVAKVTRPEGYRFELWEPSLGRPLPPGAPRLTYATWWLFDRAHVFRNDGYGVVLVWQGNCLAHRLGVFPGWFRFPFMEEGRSSVGGRVHVARPPRSGRLATHAVRFAMQARARDSGAHLLVRNPPGECGFGPHRGTGRLSALWQRDAADGDAGCACSAASNCTASLRSSDDESRPWARAQREQREKPQSCRSSQAPVPKPAPIFPRVLVVSHNPFHLEFHSNSLTLSSLFQGWPKDRIAPHAAYIPLRPTSEIEPMFDVCDLV